MLNSYLWSLMEIINYMTLQNIFLVTLVVHEEKLMNPTKRDITIFSILSPDVLFLTEKFTFQVLY